MVSEVDLCNESLSDIGARATIASLQDKSSAAINCNIWYNRLRKNLLRTAPWGFARATDALSQLGAITNIPPDNIYPWAYKYEYPAACIKFRYVLPPPFVPAAGTLVPPTTGNTAPLICAPWAMPSRSIRYLVSTENVQIQPGIIQPRKLLLCNQQSAYGVYTADIEDPDQFDEGFHQALVAALSSKLVMPLTGDAGMKETYEKMAQLRIAEARAADGNEAMPSTDHTPDWIMARGSGAWDYPSRSGNDMLGDYYCQWDNMSWGM